MRMIVTRNIDLGEKETKETEISVMCGEKIKIIRT